MTGAWRRLLAAAILFGLVLGMVGHYAAGADQHATVDRSYERLESPAEHVGETVSVWGTVEEGGGEALAVRIEDASWTVVGAAPTASAGDVVQVRGTVRPGREIAAERVVVSDRDRRAVMFAVSALAALLTLGHFLRSWTLAPRAVAFVPRGDAAGGEGSDA